MRQSINLLQRLAALILISISLIPASAYNYDEEAGLRNFREKSYVAALPMLQRAAKAGSLPALDALGQMYEHGWGVKADKTIMMNMYNKAALHNYPPTLFHLANYYYENGQPDKGLEMMTNASDHASTEASMFLGNLYATSDQEKAIRYYKHAAENGEYAGINEIGRIYFAANDWTNSVNVLIEALKHKAISNDMKLSLASMIAQGQGTAKNLESALMLLTELHNDGYEPANALYTEVKAEANKITAPVYPGGADALYAFLRKNARKPHAAIPSALNGTATVEFIITPDGAVSNPQYVRRCNVRVDEEVMRLVRLLRGWKPATKGGKACSTVARLSMSFSPAYSAEIKFVKVK